MNLNIEDKLTLDKIVVVENTISALAKKIARVFPTKAGNKIFMLDALRYYLDAELKTVLPICGWEYFGGELSDVKIDVLIPWKNFKGAREAPDTRF